MVSLFILLNSCYLTWCMYDTETVYILLIVMKHPAPSSVNLITEMSPSSMSTS